VRVVHQPVQNAVGERRVADLACHWATGGWLVRSSNESARGLHTSPGSRGARVQPAAPSPSRRPAAPRPWAAEWTAGADCRRRARTKSRNSGTARARATWIVASSVVPLPMPDLFARVTDRCYSDGIKRKPIVRGRKTFSAANISYSPTSHRDDEKANEAECHGHRSEVNSAECRVFSWE
jgi:hypothetical protein